VVVLEGVEDGRNGELASISETVEDDEVKVW
jgi:hypothetical protein